MRLSTPKILVVLALLGLGAACRGVHAQSGNQTISLEVGGRTRTSIVHVPPSYTSGRATPLVILLHGGGGNGAQAERAYGMDPIADREGFIVAYPNGTSRMGNLLTWDAANCCSYAYENGVDDVGFIRALIDELESTYTIDPRRIYATGMSNGGMMTYRLGCQLADRLAAIAPVAGSLNDESCIPSSPVSVIAFHGTADQHVPYDGGFGSASLYPHEDKPVSYAISFWVARDGCSPAPTTVTSPSGDIITDTYSGGIGGSEVILYTVVGGGHAWPGSDGSITGDVPTQEISASELMWAFFQQHPKVDDTAPVSVHVSSPNGGERYRRRDGVAISWAIETSSTITSQEIRLSPDSGKTWPTVISTVADPATRSFGWTIPRDIAKGKHYRVQVVVTTMDGMTAGDDSDADFRIKK